jgi:hypothetical protein
MAKMHREIKDLVRIETAKAAAPPPVKRNQP